MNARRLDLLVTGPSDSHPAAAMSRSDARSQKRRGGFAQVLKNCCPSAIDPITDNWRCVDALQLLIFCHILG